MNLCFAKEFSHCLTLHGANKNSKAQETGTIPIWERDLEALGSLMRLSNTPSSPF
jgi:hypothetical protein